MTMKKERIERVRLQPDGTVKSGRTGRKLSARIDLAKIDSAAAFEPDADTPILTVRELHEFKRVEDADVKPALVRKKLHMSQAAFAKLFGLSVSTVRDWEQGRRKPEGPARVLLQVIDREPQAVRRALAE